MYTIEFAILWKDWITNVLYILILHKCLIVCNCCTVITSKIAYFYILTAFI